VHSTANGVGSQAASRAARRAAAEINGFSVHGDAFDSKPPRLKIVKRPRAPPTTAPAPSSTPGTKDKGAKEQKKKKKQKGGSKPRKPPACRYRNDEALHGPLPPTQQFDPLTKLTDFGGDLRRYAWREMACSQSPAEYDETRLRQRETEIAATDTPFAIDLRKQLLRRGTEQIRRGQYKLDRWLELLAEDAREPGGGYVYIVISRGLEVKCVGETHPLQHGMNSRSTADHEKEVDSEIERLVRGKFIMKYRDAAKKAGYPNVPVQVISPLGIVIKIEGDGVSIKLRLTNNGTWPHDGTSLNETAELRRCSLASVSDTAKSCSRHGLCWLSDQSDAYFSIPVSAYSVRFMGLRWRGVTYAWTVANFGMSITPAACQSVLLCMIRVAARRCRRAGIRVGPTASPIDQRCHGTRPFTESAQLHVRAKRLAFQALHAEQLERATLRRRLTRSHGKGADGKIIPLIAAAADIISSSDDHVFRRSKQLLRNEKRTARKDNERHRHQRLPGRRHRLRHRPRPPRHLALLPHLALHHPRAGRTALHEAAQDSVAVVAVHESRRRPRPPPFHPLLG
jgi:hypothetical protein